MIKIFAVAIVHYNAFEERIAVTEDCDARSYLSHF
jgi:hypothetical protein